jgi:uncharacterized membrane protein YGL010W
MSKIEPYLVKYGESHQNHTNKMFHWVCVPSIMLSLFGLLYAIPFPFAFKNLINNWASVFIFFCLIYYIRLSFSIFLGFIPIGGLLLLIAHEIHLAVNRSDSQLAMISFGIFFVAWVGQFIGHKIEGKKPSFLEDVQYLLIGPAWLLHFIYKKIGIRY